MPYGLRGYGLGDCINTDANGVGVDSATQEACVKTGVSTVAAVPPSGPTQYGTVVGGQVVPINPAGAFNWNQFLSSTPVTVGLVGVGALFLLKAIDRR